MPKNAPHVPKSWEKLFPKTLEIHGGGSLQDIEIRQSLQRTVTFPMGSYQRGKRLFNGEEAGHFYSPIGNPTIERLEKRVALLERAESGLAVATGMSAIDLLFGYLARNGGHIVSSSRVYGGVYDLFKKIFLTHGMEVTFIEKPHDFQEWENAIRNNTRALHVEIPSNPLIDVIDIKPLADLAHAHNIFAVADNTLGTPVLIRPLDFGFDFIASSLSKYFGDGEVYGGFIGSRLKEFMDNFRKEWFRDKRPSISADSAHILCTHTESLTARIKEHCKNAEKIVAYLSEHPKVKQVFYPTVGPRVAENKRIMRRFGGLLAFEIEGGASAVEVFIDSLKLFWHAPNIGESPSLVICPRATTHNQLSEEELIRYGITEGVIRISAGREAHQNQIYDLHQAFMKI